VGLLRDEREDRGVVVCFAPGSRLSHLQAFERASRFAQTLDLGDVGGLRYVAAHAEGDKTRVTGMWVDGRLPLAELFPDEGDAPGEDPKSAPRPSGARRLLTARVEPAPYGVYLYTAKGARAEVLAAYESAVVARGFRRVDDDRAPGARAYHAGLVDLLVTVDEGTDGVTTLSIVESAHAAAHAHEGHP
jgi:hypothetical protein